ncbi:MAG: hypothetical protein MUQ10_11245 [Anaerolineae bacterium]|nr:hypothetical protein [Anaerolineae bacterium]
MNTRSSYSTKFPRLRHRHERRRKLGERLVVWVWLALVLALVASACGPATPSSPPMALPISYIVADDFAPPDRRWARFDTEESAVYALAGELYLEDRGQGTSVYTPLIGEEYVDIDVNVDVRHVQGSVNNWIGVLCRQQDEENYYLPAISADGYYLILKVVDGEATPLVGPEYSEEIRSGKAENHLRAMCKGTSLSLWVNGELLAVTSDRALPEAGNVALFADAVQRGEIVVVAFDNFVLAEP